MISWETLLSPVILFFALGALAALARSDLAIPEPLAKGMSLYLMAAIGLKGGVQVTSAGVHTDMLIAILTGVGLSLFIPLPVFAVLRRFAKLDRINAAAVAAHYGSVSVVTFVTGVEVLTALGQAPAGYMVAVLALMESPAIIVGLMLARDRTDQNAAATGRGHWHETLLNGSVVLLVGSFVIGLIAGKQGMVTIAPVFDTAFRGVLCLFLLDMGLIAARRLREARAITARLALLAVVFPALNGSIGVLLGTVLGLDAGSAASLGMLAGSASYIAVPAVMRLTLPKADPGLYIGMSLGITFPVNVLCGIPFFIFLANRLASA